MLTHSLRFGKDLSNGNYILDSLRRSRLWGRWRDRLATIVLGLGIISSTVAHASYLSIGLTPIKITASGGGPIGLAKFADVNPFGNGSSGDTTWYLPNTLRSVSTNGASLPVTWIPSAIPAPPKTDISYSELVENFAFLTTSVICPPRTADSTSSIYDPIMMLLPAKGVNARVMFACWTIVNRRGAICAFNCAISYFCCMDAYVSAMNSAAANNASSARLRIRSVLPISLSNLSLLSSSATPRHTPILQRISASPRAPLIKSQWSIADMIYIGILWGWLFSCFCVVVRVWSQR